MAYRFNNGQGAVTCDKCNIIYDAGLSYDEYKENYKNAKNVCWKCKKGLPKKNKIKIDVDSEKKI